MLEKFSNHIAANFTSLKDKSLLVACSGGLDSVVLFTLLHRLGYKLALVHCNFFLRKDESDGDEAFVKELAAKHQVRCYSQVFDTKTYAGEMGISTQMAARELRYHYFKELLTSEPLDFVLTAHHLDDDMETFFINLSRGSGLKGLTGIPVNRAKVVRPLLAFSRAEILKFAKEEGLYWREDSSNQTNDYLRNQLRHDVIPNYKTLDSGVISNFRKTQKNLQDSRLLIEDYMALIYNLVMTNLDDGYAIDIEKILELPHTNQLLYELLSPFGFTSWNDIYGLLNAQSGKQVFSKTHRLLKDRKQLFLHEIELEEEKSEFFIKKNETQIEKPIQLSIIPSEKIGYTSTTTIYVNEDQLEYPLQLRKWRKGDVFRPFGMKGNKKLSKYFKDEKLSLAAKDQVWLLCSNNQIVWIVGHRADDRFKVTPKTTKILRIAYKPN